jgi:hypothetical protein
MLFLLLKRTIFKYLMSKLPFKLMENSIFEKY